MLSWFENLVHPYPDAPPRTPPTSFLRFVWAGTWLYWLFGRLATQMPRWLSKATVNQEEPLIRTDNYYGGFEYSDAYLCDNDARFVFQFIRAAMDHGGVAANYVESLGARRADGVWITRARDGMSVALAPAQPLGK